MGFKVASSAIMARAVQDDHQDVAVRMPAVDVRDAMKVQAVRDDAQCRFLPASVREVHRGRVSKGALRLKVASSM